MALLPNKFILYSTQSQNVILPVKGYDILLLSEGADSACQQIKALPLISRVKFAFAPKVIRVFNKMLKTNFDELMAGYGNGINVRYNIKNIGDMSCYFDITPYFSYLHSKLSPVRYAQIGLGFLRKLTSEVMVSDKPKILLYYLDDAVLPERILERDLYVYMFTYAMRKKIMDFGVDKVFLMSSANKIVRCIYDKEDIKRNKYTIFLMFLRKALSKVLIADEETNKATTSDDVDEILTDKKNVKTLNQNDINNITKALARNALRLGSAVTISYKVIKDRINAFLMSSKDVSDIADKVVNTDSLSGKVKMFNAAFNKSMSPTGKILSSEPNSSVEKFEQLEDDPVIDKIESIDVVNSEKICDPLVKNNYAHSIKRRANYHKKTAELIIESITAPLSEVGYKLESVDFKLAKKDDLEIYETDIEYIIIKCKDPEGKSHIMRFMTPYLKENRFWESGGHRWYYRATCSIMKSYSI